MFQAFIQSLWNVMERHNPLHQITIIYYNNTKILTFMRFGQLIAVAGCAALLGACSSPSLLPGQEGTLSRLDVEDMGIAVSADSQREYSFTDKKSAFWYGMTHTDNWDNWHAGWNIAKRRMLSDYTVGVDGDTLSRREAEVTVFPYKINRVYEKAHENFYMFDRVELLYVELSDVKGDSVWIELSPGLISAGKQGAAGVEFVPKESAGGVITLQPFKDVPCRWNGTRLMAPADAGGFIISYTEDGSAQEVAAVFRSDHEKMLRGRIDRMNGFVERSNPLSSDNDTLDRAMAWIILTTDELVTCQQGNGIYAGLPWFNEYWGRDMFISMPGAVFCTGQWETARSIFSDFAKFQDRNPESETLGRIPNRANPDGIIYNTADGTPRFVTDVYEYMQYTGDTTFLASIYPAVELSINSVIERGTDADGFLVHADADTWMDAKRQGKFPCSPRGNRAVDIQALWYGQLRSGAEMARIMGHDDDARRWDLAADSLFTTFNRKFVNTADTLVYDHLNADGTPDRQCRPNMLYALDMVADSAVAMKETRDAWQRLVYPWGVASLDQNDPQFHPYHENWHHYHKDDAYHNGTVWLWNNGMAMQRMIEAGQQDIAWQLFENMNRQALYEGAVGSLSENADAWPRKGAQWARRSGTFLQAWSNAEHIRVWYQDFLGIRPALLGGVININPRIPSAIGSLRYSELLGAGALEGAFEREKDCRRYEYRSEGLDATLVFNIENYKEFSVPVTPQAIVRLKACADKLNVTVIDGNGRKTDTLVDIDAAKVARQKALDEYFRGTDFAVPSMRENLPSLSRYFDPPLDYSSVE